MDKRFEKWTKAAGIRAVKTVAQTAAGVASGEAAQPHGAVADVLGEQGAQRVGGLDGAVVDTGQSAGIDRGVVGRDNDGGEPLRDEPLAKLPPTSPPI